VSHEDYIRTAKAKGLSGYAVTTRHLLRNALVPVVTMMGLTWPVFLGGTVIIEVIFAWPGIGQLLLQAATNRDYAVVEAVTVVFAAIFIATNIVTDAALILIDPRIRPQ
jgi:peptide/nickel transport system permease protein